MKRLLIALMMVVPFAIANAAPAVGHTYRITSKKFPTKSLFIKNAAKAVSTDVVLWTETNVSAQQWRLNASSDTTVAFSSPYVNYYATPSNQRAGGKLRMGRLMSNAAVKLVAAEESAGAYRITTLDGSCCLTVTSGENGEVPVWAALNNSDGDGQLWLLEEVAAQDAFNADLRNEMMDTFMKQFCTTKGTGMWTFVKGGWGEAEMMEVVLDAYESTGNEEYLNKAKYVYNYFKNRVGDSWDRLVYDDNYHWFGHDFNDDVMWEIIAVARLGWLTGNKTYTNAAKRNFDKIYDRAYIPFTGLMRWAQNSGDAYGTNSCIAGPTEVAACYLGMSGAGEEYFEKARDLYAAQRYVLANNMLTGKVWDSVVWNPSTEKVKSKNEWASTYNQGTMLGAACLLYDHYGDEQYLKDAQKLMSFTKSELCDAYGHIKVCQDEANGDLCGFKGILMRYVRRFVLDLCQPTYQKWLIDNAWLAYCNRSEKGLTGTGWLTKATTSSTTNAFGCSTSVSAAVNAPLGDVIKQGFDTLQIEQFDYHRGMIVKEARERGGGKVVFISNGYWTQYDNVDFGEQTARSIAVEVSSPETTSTGTVEIYFDRMDGTPAGIVEIKDLDATATWHTLYADITPTTGQHHVYLRFTSSSTRAKIYQADQFCFYTETADVVQTGVRQPQANIANEITTYYDLNGRQLPTRPQRGPFVMRQGFRSRVVVK